MKKISCYTAFFCAMFLFLASTVKSQDVKMADNANEKWHPVKINESGNVVNLINGVSFFSRETICNGKQIILIRLSNSNLSSANVSYIENGVRKSLTILPSSIMEGTCALFTNTDEKNPMSSLVYLKPVTDVEKAAKKRILASLKVTIEK